MVASTSLQDQKFVFVVGPTGSGKSAWALAQAKKYSGSIVNCDSVQFYKGLEIGSAAPNLTEKQSAPHFLYNYVQAPQEMTAGQFLRDFYQLIETKVLKFPVFIVGGTGFYVQALEKGMYDIEPADLGLRAIIESELKSQGPGLLHDELTKADPEHLIHLNDHYRLVRAIEILRTSGETPTQLKARAGSAENKNAFPFPYLKIGFSQSKEIAQSRIQDRSKKMIENGLLSETQFFLNNGFSEWGPLASVGYKEAVDCLINQKSKSELLENVVTSTMQLIKKQKTWFKRDASILWSDEEDHNQTKINQQLDLYLTTIDPSTLEKGY